VLYCIIYCIILRKEQFEINQLATEYIIILGITIPRLSYVMSVWLNITTICPFIKANKMSWTVLQATRATNSSAEPVPVQVQEHSLTRCPFLVSICICCTDSLFWVGWVKKQYNLPLTYCNKVQSPALNWQCAYKSVSSVWSILSRLWFGSKWHTIHQGWTQDILLQCTEKK